MTKINRDWAIEFSYMKLSKLYHSVMAKRGIPGKTKNLVDWTMEDQALLIEELKEKYEIYTSDANSSQLELPCIHL